MGGPTSRVTHDLTFEAKLLADHIRDVAITDGKVDGGMVEWGRFAQFAGPVREALLVALQDLYIDPFEALGIMEKAGYNQAFATRLVADLRRDPPLFHVAQRFCSQEQMDIKVRNALEYAAQDDVNPEIQKAAQGILDSCKIFVATKLDE